MYTRLLKSYSYSTSWIAAGPSSSPNAFHDMILGCCSWANPEPLSSSHHMYVE
ncbi:hypothetical protein BDA96_04G175200 [Sorghum bicolor]|uniref:Uncharacterized protein n=1 Tax=Sorghum bicolor TaxID=4558 RepID=A0A921R3E4_SORBI|nr:hypothetical protein BDA96_04G175200 [Sorghum bicolor]